MRFYKCKKCGKIVPEYKYEEHFSQCHWENASEHIKANKPKEGLTPLLLGKA